MNRFTFGNELGGQHHFSVHNEFVFDQISIFISPACKDIAFLFGRIADISDILDFF